jgi:hypothetical protein
MFNENNIVEHSRDDQESKAMPGHEMRSQNSLLRTVLEPNLIGKDLESKLRWEEIVKRNIGEL